MDKSQGTARERPGGPAGVATALLLMAHGSRLDDANADLHHVVAEMRRRGRYTRVEASFLELAEPAIEQAAAACVGQGCRRVILLPYFLSAGVHVRRDLAEMQRQLADRFPAVEFVLAEPLGTHPLLLEVVAERAREAEGDPFCRRS
jgi:sirohydrochlorin ferrochelatase